MGVVDTSRSGSARDGIVTLGTTDRVEEAADGAGTGRYGRGTALARATTKTPRRRTAPMPRSDPKRDIFIR